MTNTKQNPSRRGFYVVETVDGDEFVANWTFVHPSGKQGNAWFVHVGETPSSVKAPQLLDKEVVSFRAATKEQINEATKREFTVEEKIEQAYEGYCSFARLAPQYPAFPPEARQLSIGESVQMGNLKDCVVVGFREEGRVVIISFHNLNNVYGKLVDNGIAYRASHWTSVFSRKFETRKMRSTESMLTGAFTARTVESMVQAMLDGMTGHADFQRGYVWSEEDQQRFLDTLMQGRDLGKIVIIKMPYPQRNILLDGKQRMNCVMQFVQSEISWRGVYWHELSQLDRHKLNDRVLHTAMVESEQCTLVEQLKMFLEINAGGVPQTEEHLNKVRDMLVREEARIAAL